MPACATMMSRRPKRSTAPSTSGRHRRLVGRRRRGPRQPARRSRRALPRDGRRTSASMSATTTRAPRSSSVAAVASPMPRAAPVTIATRSSSVRRASGSSLRGRAAGMIRAMSLVGIDVGSSVTKVVAFAPTARCWPRRRERRRHPPATRLVGGRRDGGAGRDLGARSTRWPRRRRRRDPPTALAISASAARSCPSTPAARRSGRCCGRPTAAPRRPRAGAGETHRGAERLGRACGHVPDHMDPMNRLLWWREHDPAVYDRDAPVPRLARAHHAAPVRRAVIDHGLAGKFFAYDLATRRLVAGAARRVATSTRGCCRD